MKAPSHGLNILSRVAGAFSEIHLSSCSLKCCSISLIRVLLASNTRLLTDGYVVV